MANVTVSCFFQEASSLSPSILNTMQPGTFYKTEQGHVSLCPLFFYNILNFNIIVQNAQDEKGPNIYNPISS